MFLDGNIFVSIKTEDGNILLSSAEAISFSIRYNIHNVYPKMNMSLEDVDGLFAEYLMTTPGLKYSVEFGIEGGEENIKGDFVIQKDITTKLRQTELFAGTLDISLIHAWSTKQKRETLSYNKNISDIVKQLVNNYNFRSQNIENTQNKEIWYQGKQKQSEFIKKGLLPYAYNSTETPFYFYIDCQNNVNFHSYDSFVKNSPNRTHEYTYQRQASHDDAMGNLIIDIRRWSEDKMVLDSEQKQETFSVNRDGELIKIDYNSSDFLKKKALDAEPFVKNEEGIGQYYYRGINRDITNSDKGYRLHKMRRLFHPERYMVMVPFNPKIKAGDIFKMRVYLPNDSNETFSERFTGDYVIEMSEHIWDGETMNAITKTIISRKYIQVPDDYIIKEKL